MSDGWGRRQAQTRRAVTDAVGELIAEGGADNLSMRRLADRAGVAVATLYNQFGDRDGVLLAFVAVGLDELEGELDAAPDAGPIDTTRRLFDALDAALSLRPDVWRAVFTSLGLGVVGNDLGDFGDRLIAYIASDLAKAATDGYFVIDCDTDRLARHILITRINRVEKWANGHIAWDDYRASSQLGLELILASVLTEPHRSVALERSGTARSD